MDRYRSDIFRKKVAGRMRRVRSQILCALSICVFSAMGAGQARAQMTPYFTAIGNTMPKDHLMLMLLPDYQLARVGPDYLTYMGMAEYGVTDRLTAGFMAEGQKIRGLPGTFGGVRFNAYYQLFPHDHWLHATLYGEFEDLNQASLYKMEVSGFGVSDLTEPLGVARHLPAHTFEQRFIAYHDWGPVNFTFNFVSELDLQTDNNAFGYVWGASRRPDWDGMRDMDGTGGNMPTPPALSARRFGYGVEMMGGLGDTQRFGFFWHREQQYLGPVLSYSLARHLRFRLEPEFGLSDASDRFVLRMGFDYTIRHLFRR